MVRHILVGFWLSLVMNTLNAKVDAANNAALVNKAKVIPQNSANHPIGIIPNGMSPWVAQSIAMTRPRIVGGTTS